MLHVHKYYLLFWNLSLSIRKLSLISTLMFHNIIMYRALISLLVHFFIVCAFCRISRMEHVQLMYVV